MDTPLANRADKEITMDNDFVQTEMNRIQSQNTAERAMTRPQYTDRVAEAYMSHIERARKWCELGWDFEPSFNLEPRP